ncbi:MAG: enoyl-CoA hydratase/isomerase family protein [bacterium]
MTSAYVTVQREPGAVAVVTFSRAESMNSFDPKVIGELHRLFRSLLDDVTVRGIVLTGTGKAFCAGADVREFEKGVQSGTAVQWVLDATAALHPLLLEIQESPKVFVAALNGVAAGGGLGLALVADARIANPQARLAASYFRLGLSPDGGATWLMPRLVGFQRARQFFFNNEVMDAEEAFVCGAVDELVPADKLLPRAIELARTWGAWAAHSRGATKRLLAASENHDFGTQLDLERGLIAAAAGTKDFAEGVTAFRGKREPKFA